MLSRRIFILLSLLGVLCGQLRLMGDAPNGLNTVEPATLPGQSLTNSEVQKIIGTLIPLRQPINQFLG